jgi:hypothetical protein
MQLDPAIHTRIQFAVGMWLPPVRIHQDDAADRLTSLSNARAFTLGHDVFFRRGLFAPETPEGLSLLGHEMFHARAEPVEPRFSGEPGAAGTVDEQAANRAGEAAAAAGGPPLASGLPAQGSASPGEIRIRLGAFGPDMARAARRALERVDTIAGLWSECVNDLKASREQLRALTASYAQGYRSFIDVLKVAERDEERRRAVSEAVQGLMIGTAVGVLSPGAALVGFWWRSARLQLSRRVIQRGVVELHLASGEGLPLLPSVLDELAELGVGAMAGLAQGTRKLTDTAGAAGPTPADKLELAFAAEGELIDAVPDLSDHIEQQTAVARIPLELVERAATARWSQADLAAKAETFMALEARSEDVFAQARELREAVRAVAQRITSIPSWDPATVELNLWRNWVLSLDPPADELDHKVIRERIRLVCPEWFANISLSEVAVGERVPEWVHRKLITNARRSWLEEHGVRVERQNDDWVTGRYRAEMARDELEKRLRGRPGQIVAGDSPNWSSILVDGRRYQLTLEARRTAQAGQQVTVEGVEIPWHLLGEPQNIERWDEWSFELRVRR